MAVRVGSWFVLIAACLAPAIARAQTWWDDAWTWRQELVLGDAGTSVALTDFALMVRLTPSRVDYARFGVGGSDLRFVDIDQETVLEHEIEVWNPSGDSIVWVRLPSLSASDLSAGSVWMYYGNAAASDGQDPNGTWASAYRAVWHLSGTANSTALAGSDLISMNGASGTTGRLGGGYRLDGVDDYLTQANDLGAWLASADGSLELWIRSSDTGTLGPASSGAVGLMGAHDSNPASGGFNDLHLGWVRSGATQALCVSGEDVAGQCVSPAVDGTWHHLVFTRDGTGTGAGEVDVFLDGVRLVSGQPGGGGTEPVAFTDLGRVAGLAGSNLAADIDEVRILAGRVGTSHVAAHYRSQSDALVEFGPPSGQAVPALPSWPGTLVLVGALLATARLARSRLGAPRARSGSVH